MGENIQVYGENIQVYGENIQVYGENIQVYGENIILHVYTVTIVVASFIFFRAWKESSVQEIATLKEQVEEAT